MNSFVKFKMFLQKKDGNIPASRARFGLKVGIAA